MTEERLERLNAYVDGELSPEDRSDIAREIADDPAAARAVAALTSAKANVRQAYASDKADFVAGASGGSRGPVYMIAASVAILIVAGLGLWIAASSWQGGDRRLADALGLYDSWQGTAATELIWAKAPSGTGMPDLRPAGLTLFRVDPSVRLGGTVASHVTYLGKNGCRLSLFSYDAPDGRLIPAASHSSPDVLSEAWSISGTGYLLLARKMNGKRFQVLAKAIQEATVRTAPLRARTRLAMRSARQPCRT